MSPHREQPPDSKRAWVARDELEQNGPRATAVAYRLDAALHPPGPDPLAVDVARTQLEAARARYQAAIATSTPVPWSTPTLVPSVVDAADPTHVRALVPGRVVEVRIVSLVGNEATVEVVVELTAHPPS